MYAVSNVNRVYISLFLCLCAAVLLAPSVNAADGGYWSTQERRFISQTEVNNRLNQISNSSIAKPSNSTLSISPSAPTITKNASGGLSASTNQILKTMGQPSNFTSTSNFSLNSAKNALKSCVRSPSCAGRTLGGGAIIYDGINSWKDVYDLLQDPQTQQVTMPDPENKDGFQAPPYPDPITQVGARALSDYDITTCPSTYDDWVVVRCTPYPQFFSLSMCLDPYASNADLRLVGFDGSRCQYAYDDPYEPEVPRVPLSPDDLDNLIDEGYEPAESDAPIILLSDTPPATIEISTPAPAQLPSETRTDTSSAGTTTTVIDRTINYTVNNNNTANPSITSSVTEISTTYDSNSNVVNTSTSTTSNPAVAPDPVAADPVIDFELPSFCSWASIVCDWIGWTKEPLGEDDPDLSQLITVFEPDEGDFDLGIGSGSCPAPMMLNLAIINKTVEVKYDPFCDFLEMIRPFVLAAAYLFAAYLYLGVLRRG